MYPVHDVDALLILSISLSAKRRPAELIEVIAAADLIQESAAAEFHLFHAFQRMSQCGLICAKGTGYELTADGQKIVMGQAKKLTNLERIPGIRDNLAAYNSKVEHAVIEVSQEQLDAAVLAHRGAANPAVKNLFVPRPKPTDAELKRQGRRKPLPSRRR